MRASRRCWPSSRGPRGPSLLDDVAQALEAAVPLAADGREPVTRRDERSAIHLDVLVDGVPRATVVAGVDDGWVQFAIPTEPGAADVTFVASAAAPNKLVCFAAEALR